jgi:hypothetical protein
LDRSVERLIIVPPLGLAESIAGRNQIQQTAHRHVPKMDSAFRTRTALEDLRQRRVETWKAVFSRDRSEPAAKERKVMIGVAD